MPSDHPLRPIRALADEVLAGLSGHFESLYSGLGRRAAYLKGVGRKL